MVPLTITLRNFMSYGDEPQTLDFAGMHVACLSGDNGNGKSALLDAMTYCLWGKTRATGSQASGEDDLVRLSAEEMEVRFEFLLGEDHYRILRKRNKRTRAGDWQVHLKDGKRKTENETELPESDEHPKSEIQKPKSDGIWLPVGGSSIRETERNLVRILRMEYETFLNSAYFQQGRADEFTRQKPDARKRILADVLDLSRYDRLEEMARQRRTDCELEAKELEGEIRHLEARAAEEPGFREALSRHEEALTSWTAERTVRETTLNSVRSELAVLSEKEARLRERDERLQDVRRELDELAAEIARLSARIEIDEALLRESEQIRSDVTRLHETRVLVEQLEKEVQEVHRAREALAAADGRLKLRKRELENELSHAESEWRTVQDRAARIQQLEAKIAESEPKMAQLLEAEQEMAAVRAELSSAVQKFSDLGAQSKRFRNEIEDVDQALALLNEAKSACPICEASLTGDRQRAVILRLRNKKANYEASLKETNREGGVVKKLRDDLQAKLDALNARLAGAAAIKGQKTEMERTRAELIEQNLLAADVEEHLATLRKRLDSEEFGAEEREEIRSLETRIVELKTASDRYTAARSLVKELTERGTESRNARLEEAERSHAQLLQDLSAVTQRREKRCGQVEAEENRLATLRSELRGLDGAREAAIVAERECAEAVRESDSARSLVERAKHALEGCVAAREQRDRKAAEREKILIDRQAYTDLAAAFGKKGVQALIIDNALPEIQDEANRLLARMTDNQMQVALSTIRAARSGAGHIETLDITITDDAGTRPYEMYSGGEAFRVNFAIRIALSRLLARRAGARLQTLIIDEGFGTQDAKGRERLVEAISSIQDEFSLILVITHLEELKDQFPTRVEIIKTPAGSQISFVD